MTFVEAEHATRPEFYVDLWHAFWTDPTRVNNRHSWKHIFETHAPQAFQTTLALKPTHRFTHVVGKEEVDAKGKSRFRSDNEWQWKNERGSWKSYDPIISGCLM